MAEQFQSNMQQAISLFQQKIPVGLGLQNGDEMGLVLWGISPVLYLRKDLKPQIRHPHRRISPGLFICCLKWQRFIKLH